MHHGDPAPQRGILLPGRAYWRRSDAVSFSEQVRLLQANGLRLVREKGSIRYYGKAE